MTNSAAELKPYESWVEFAANLKHEASIINFIAAYGTHELITGQTTHRWQARRGADHHHRAIGRRLAGSDGCRWTSSTAPAPTRAANALGGLDNVDLWIGGLAEKNLPFGGMLGSTFNFVFEVSDGAAAERRPLLLPAAARRPASVRRDGGQLLRRHDHAQHRRDASAVGRVLDPRPDPRGRPHQAVQSGTRRDGRSRWHPGRRSATVGTDESADNLGDDPMAAESSPRWSSATTRRRRARTPTTCATPATSTSCSAAPTGNDILIASTATTRSMAMAATTASRVAPATTSINGGDGDDIIKDLGGDDNIKGGARQRRHQRRPGSGPGPRRLRQGLHRPGQRRRRRSVRR